MRKRKKKITWDDIVFCANCDYAISKLERDLFLGRPAAPCPRCGYSRLDMFYEYGSCSHRERWELWKDGKVSGNVVVFPGKRD